MKIEVIKKYLFLFAVVITCIVKPMHGYDKEKLALFGIAVGLSFPLIYISGKLINKIHAEIQKKWDRHLFFACTLYGHYIKQQLVQPLFIKCYPIFNLDVYTCLLDKRSCHNYNVQSGYEKKEMWRFQEYSVVAELRDRTISFGIATVLDIAKSAAITGVFYGAYKGIHYISR